MHDLSHDTSGLFLPHSNTLETLKLRCQTQVRDRTGRNLLRNRVLVVGNIYPDLLQSHHFQRRSNGWLHPRTVRMKFGDHARHPLCRPVMKSHKGLLQPGVKDSCLGLKQEHCLYPRHLEPPRCYLILSHPSQYLPHPSPFSLRPPEVPFHCQKIVVLG